MTIPHAQLEALARQICEASVEDKGRYDRKGCKRAYWRKRAQAMYERVHAQPAVLALYRACGWEL